jgi:molecular chaperone IbpA
MNFISSPLMKSFVGFDNLFDEFDRISNFKDQSYPAYDIEKVSESEYKISLALAGFKEKDLSVEVKDNELSISTSRGDETQTGSFIHQGIAKRPFKRLFRLADNLEVTDAELMNGLLVISLLQSIPESEQAKQITIRSQGKSLTKKAA